MSRGMCGARVKTFIVQQNHPHRKRRQVFDLAFA